MSRQEYSKVKLADVATLVNGRAYLMPELQDSGKYKIVRVGNFSGKDEWFYSDMELEPDKYCYKGDLLYKWACTFGPEIWNDKKTIYHYHIWKIVNDPERIDRDYLYYLLKAMTPYWLAGTHGSTMVHITKEGMEDNDITIPVSTGYQKTVAQILRTIDDKIALSKKMMAELEDTARLIYDYWFTQFDFPDENGKPYRSSGGKMVYNETLKREIPEGWEAVSVNELVHVEKGISYKANDLKGEGVPMVNLASFDTGGTYKAEGLKSYSGAIDSRKTVLPLDLVMCITQQTAIDLSGKTNVIGKTFFVPDIFDNTVVISTDVCKLMVGNEAYAYVLNGLFKRSDIHKYIVGFANGTKIKHLDTSAAFNLRFAVPPNGSDVLECYSVKARLFEKEKSNLLRENLCLGVLRDWLLPMLMNGQVHVD